MTDQLKGKFAEIADRRTEQDAKWGGKEHDDENVPMRWTAFLREFVNKAEADVRLDELERFRHHLIDIAALACAAAESFDRVFPDRIVKPEPTQKV